ncbi:sigma-70 family RNA polymerase sigma factor [Saccharothrix sp. NRRL B-16348]|uniref:sigma-70 family RNA polymerase sigma factor n=1 Tax=Saccharothrix sp. NRRL B-16348 TaxID=1415542 RepID=UPI000B32D29F|nr:sigma-70 family RNA polymerase sigma factor [Saccharothrix sp. NRRL B-16348]
MTTDDHAERFTLLRPLLFTIAYEVLGSATEADDVLQDSYLRWAEVDLATVRDTKSYLARLVTRQALNALRASARRREDYVGPWLPEPVLIEQDHASADVVLAESVSMAMLVVLETLTPDERVVFVLREVFGFHYDEIAAAVGKSVATARQAAHRAREHVQARRKRFGPADAATTARIQFGAAVAIAVPAFVVLKEWAYAGVLFRWWGAVVSHLAVGDGPVSWGPPLMFSAFAVASWVLRPADRRLPQTRLRPADAVQDHAGRSGTRSRAWAVSIGLVVALSAVSLLTLPAADEFTGDWAVERGWAERQP